MTSLFLLEPENPGAAWAPFAGAAPLSTLRVGGWTAAERWVRAFGSGSASGIITPDRYPLPNGSVPFVDPGEVRGPAWIVDVTFAPAIPMRQVGGAKRLLFNQRAVAWRLDPGETWSGPHDSGDGMVIDGLPMQGAWDLVTALEKFLFSDTLADLERGGDSAPDGSIVIGNPAAIAIRGATVEPGVVFDVQRGAVILEQGVTVKSGTRLEGPCWIREGTVVNGGAIKHVSVGSHCRVHGEMSTTVINGYSNKAHDGFVGHTAIGSWVNLGAGTITSNLKNTYGPVRVEPAGERFDTGRMMLGSLIGDHAKTAIGTLLPTGTVVGAGANIFGAVRAARYTAPFAWGDGEARIDADRFLEVARRVLPRREVNVDAQMEASLRAMHQRLTGGG
jgi:UDP-N-acetylglucosamine diphosphorylase/glucosamine-1-phosphate N-acetyltransferase